MPKWRFDQKAAARRLGLDGLTAGGRISRLRYGYQLTADCTESVCSGSAAAGS